MSNPRPMTEWERRNGRYDPPVRMPIADMLGLWMVIIIAGLLGLYAFLFWSDPN